MGPSRSVIPTVTLHQEFSKGSLYLPREIQHAHCCKSQSKQSYIRVKEKNDTFRGKNLFLKINLLGKGLTQGITGDRGSLDELLTTPIIGRLKATVIFFQKEAFAIALITGTLVKALLAPEFSLFLLMLYVFKIYEI